MGIPSNRRYLRPQLVQRALGAKVKLRSSVLCGVVSCLIRYTTYCVTGRISDKMYISHSHTTNASQRLHCDARRGLASVSRK